jgi:hypothetical protein
MLLSFVYLVNSALLRLLIARRRSDFAKDVELLVLRLWVPQTASPRSISRFFGVIRPVQR